MSLKEELTSKRELAIESKEMNDKYANMLGFSTLVEMELFYDVCNGYFANQIPSKQDCLRIVEAYGLQNTLNKFLNMSKSERIAYELHRLTGTLIEAISVEDYKETDNIIAIITKKTFELQKYNSKDFENDSHLKK